MRVTLNKREINYANFVRRIIKETFSEEPTIRIKKNQEALDIRLQKRRAVEQAMLLGLEKGNRVEKEVGIPKWIFLKREFIESCLRGLIDTDGSLYYLKPHWPNLRQLSFKSENPSLLRDVRNALVRLGFKPSKIFGNRIVMTRQGEIARYFKEIGTNNDKYSPVV